MSMRKRSSTIFGVAIVSMLVAQANAQVTDQAEREQASNTLRSQLHLKPNQFLRVQRDEELEQLLAAVVSRPSWSEFIDKASEEGDEIKEHVIVHHIVMDGDPTFTIAVSPVNGTAYRIQGFSDSLSRVREADERSKREGVESGTSRGCGRLLSCSQSGASFDDSAFQLVRSQVGRRAAVSSGPLRPERKGVRGLVEGR
jgi:hypothetical protein